jgi:hypothetical protein
MIDNIHWYTTLDDGLIWYWNFDNWTAEDVSSNWFNWSFTNDAYHNSNTFLDWSAEFDGVGDTVSIPNNGTYSFWWQDHTLSAWINADTLWWQRWIISKSNWSSWWWFILNGSKVNFWYHSCSNFNSISNVSTNTWYHVLATYDVSEDIQRIYIDGVLDIESNALISPDCSSASDNNVLIWWYRNNWTFDGNIDDVRIYDRVLSEDEVEQLYIATNEIKDWDWLIYTSIKITIWRFRCRWILRW